MIDRYLYRVIKESLGESYINQYTSDFSTRLIVQKVLYLLTHGKENPKLDLDYQWSFYIRGPYSSDIAHMLYHINALEINMDESRVELKKEDEKAIKHVKEVLNGLNDLLKKNEGTSISKEEFFELVATLTYIASQIGTDPEKLRQKLKDFKSDIEKKLEEHLFNELHELLLNYNYI